jgi:starvation-inducible DNA-binding protein
MKISNLDENTKTRIVEGLDGVLSDHYNLLVKTHSCHWNVTGPNFIALHSFFEEQYTDIFSSIDEIAERIRSLGAYVPASLRHFDNKSEMNDTASLFSNVDMMTDLFKSYEKASFRLEKMIKVCDEFGDDVTSDMMTDRLKTFDKTMWMLKSINS